MRFLCGQRILKVMVISLVIVFGPGVLFDTAQANPYRLAELIQSGEPISVGSVTFSNFALNNLGPPPPFSTPAKAAGLFVELVGEGTPQPGLRILANNQLLASGAASVTKATLLSYKVHVTDSNSLLQGRSLLLVPGSAASGSSNQLLVYEDIRGGNRLSVSRMMPPNPATPSQLFAEEDFSDPQEELSIDTIILIQAIPDGADELGQVAIHALEQRFKLAPTRAEAGPDQVVQDGVFLDGSGSEGNIVSYKWSLVPRDPSLPEITPDPIMNPSLEIIELAKGLYDVTLTVTDQNGFVDTDTMLLAAAGPCESEPPAPPPTSGKLKLWNFDIKKYRFSNWASASMYGTFDASDLPLRNCKDKRGLKAKVTLQVVDKAGNAVGEWSGETRAEIKNSRYKCVIRKRH